MILALRPRTKLSAEERLERHRLMVRDTVVLSSLLTLVVVLSLVTYGLFHSFAAHRLTLEQRWKQRGEAALRDGKPQAAIESLRSALAYSPDDRGLQVELATALAAAGRSQEALVYFNTLHEQQPGDGMINLQLARLAVRQANLPMAIEDYEVAIDGTWNGDGVLRRREARLELAHYLIAQHRFEEARNQLLIAAGNAADNHPLQLTIAGLLEQAEGDSDAFTLYRRTMAFRDTRTAALIGAGRTAAAQSRFLLARNLLEQATTQPDYARLPADERDAVHDSFDQATQILVLFPSPNLTPHARAIRAVHDARLAQARLSSCAKPAAAPLKGSSGTISIGSTQVSNPAGADTSAAQSTAPAVSESGGALRSALGAVERARESLTRPPSTSQPVAGPAAVEAGGAADSMLNGLAVRWQQLPPDAMLLGRLESDPALLQSTIQLIYDTEKTTAQVCGSPTGEDLRLLKIAAAPDEIEQQ